MKICRKEYYLKHPTKPLQNSFLVPRDENSSMSDSALDHGESLVQLLEPTSLETSAWASRLFLTKVKDGIRR